MKSQELQSRITDELNVERVVLTGYPTDLFSDSRPASTGPLGAQRDGRTSEGCGVFGTTDVVPAPELVNGVSLEEAQLFRDWGTALRDTQAELASRFGWEYVDVSDEFEGHGYCTGVSPGRANNCSRPRTSFLVSAERSCVIQGNLLGAMHPDKCGHDVYRNEIVPIIQEHPVFSATEGDGGIPDLDILGGAVDPSTDD